MSDPGEAVFVLRGFNNHLIETATETEFKPVGLGIDYRYTAQRGTASALVLDNKVVHFSAFSDSTKEEPVKHSSDLVKDETDISVIISKRFRKILNDKLSQKTGQ